MVRFKKSTIRIYLELNRHPDPIIMNKKKIAKKLKISVNKLIACLGQAQNNSNTYIRLRREGLTDQKIQPWFARPPQYRSHQEATTQHPSSDAGTQQTTGGNAGTTPETPYHTQYTPSIEQSSNWNPQHNAHHAELSPSDPTPQAEGKHGYHIVKTKNKTYFDTPYGKIPIVDASKQVETSTSQNQLTPWQVANARAEAENANIVNLMLMNSNFQVQNDRDYAYRLFNSYLFFEFFSKIPEPEPKRRLTPLETYEIVDAYVNAYIAKILSRKKSPTPTEPPQNKTKQASQPLARAETDELVDALNILQYREKFRKQSSVYQTNQYNKRIDKQRYKDFMKYLRTP